MSYFDEEIFENTVVGDILNNENNEFVGCTFKSIDFSNSMLRGQSFLECHFLNCNLSNVETMGSTYRDVEFVGCKLIGVNWSNSKSFVRVVIKDSILNYSVFQNMKLKYLECTDSTAIEVDFSEADLENSNFSRTNLRQTSFSNCNLTKANFRGATEYMIDPNFAKIKKAKFNLPEAVALLEAFDIELD